MTQDKKSILKNRNKRLYFAVIVLLSMLPFPAFAQNHGVENLRQTGKTFSAVAKKVSPAVVFIQVRKTVQNRPTIPFRFPFGDGDEFFRRFFGPDFPGTAPRQNPPQVPQAPRQMTGQGSGFIVSKDGYILTNNHVVGGADEVTVRFQDGREFSAETVGTDPHSDVAVIKIDADNLPHIPLGDSEALEVGEWVIAIGNPFGLSHTLTVGVVSAKGRSSVGVADYENFIQTDAAINPGNSGGPLINLDGEVVGMNTAIFTQSGGYMGIGFAIPINMAKDIMGQLIKSGTVTRGYLGISIQNLTPDLAKSFGIDRQKGVLVAEVLAGSPAEKAGIKQGDVIIEFAGKPVKDTGSFRNSVSLKTPGTKQKLAVVRNRKKVLLNVTLGKLPHEQLASNGDASQRSARLGLSVKPLNTELARQFGLSEKQGVVVTAVAPGSAADLAGIRPGALVLEVNRQKIRTLRDFRKALAKSAENDPVLLLIKQDGSMRFVSLKRQQ